MDEHKRAVCEQFSLQAGPFTGALHANDPALIALCVEAAAPRAGDLVADFCSGPGIIAAALAVHCRRVLCLDLTESMLREAARIAPSAFRVEGDATRAPLRDAAFAISMSRLAFHHVRELDDYIAAMIRAAVPGGRIVVCDIVTSEDSAESEETERIERLRDPSHARCLTRTELHSLFVRHGIRVEFEREWEMIVDHDEWMNRVYPPEVNRPVIRRLLEALEGHDRGGMKVWRENERLMILRRGVIIAGRRTDGVILAV
jgi:SAM-dependent methyltransferase